MQLPDLTSAPQTGCGTEPASLAQSGSISVWKLLRDGALCPGDSNMGMSPRSHTGSPLAQPRVLNGIQTQTAVPLGAPSFETCCPAALCPHCTLTQEADPREAVVTQEAGRGTLVCSPPKLSSRAKRKSEERKWNAHQPSNRGGFLSLRLLTKSPQLTSHLW